MEKKIEDYLPLYMGCNLHINSFNYGEIIAPLVSIETDGNVMRIGVLYNEERIYGYADQVKLILRPLSDMTEDEAIEVCKVSGYKEHNQTVFMGKTHIDRDRFKPHVFHFLLSKHFDLFDLISSGLALDATTISKNK